jgi:hypothetical protein
MKHEDRFDIEKVMRQLETLIDIYVQEKEVLFEEFCHILDHFCLLFKVLNSFLGIAFSDVKQKVEVIRENNQTYPRLPGFLAFVRLEMDKNIHIYNGDNNGDLKAPKEHRKYNSTARNLLRMMWLLTFIRVTFEEIRDPQQSMADILCKAYDAAFGEKHSWIIRKGAKFAIKASGDRSELIDAVMGAKCEEETFQKTVSTFLERFVPIHEALWGFYREYKLTNLD